MARLELRSAEETYRAFTIQTMGRLPNAGELNRIRGAEDGGPVLMPEAGNMPGAGRRDDGSEEQPRAIERPQRTGMSVVRDLMFYHAGRTPFKPWLKDMWNDVFLLRGVYAQDRDRPYEVFAPQDFGARVWSDLCDVKVPLTDADGEYLDVPEVQPYCNLEAERFAYPPAVQPNAPRAARNLTPEEFCDDRFLSRQGLARLMLYGAVEEPLELIAYIIQSDRPFTEIVTSNAVMMNYYTSLAYFGTADPDGNDFTANMDDVPMRRDFMSGPDFVRFQADLPDHRYFKPMERLRRTEYDEYRPPGLPAPQKMRVVSSFETLKSFPVPAF